MAKQFTALDATLTAFIGRQHVFFAASAAPGSRVNVSPKDGASFRVLGPNRAAWLDQTGSGNETAAHTLAGGPVTVMFCAFQGPPLILRLYGRARIALRGAPDYARLLAEAFAGEEPPGARQIVVLDFDLVQTSCGYGVPLFDHVGERDNLRRWAEAKGEDGLDDYRREKNAVSLDGLPTGMFDLPAAE
ncbi:hypothetical protein ACO2Q3_05955 [Caulobacter sp. KR2-114]|uniref:pyridoxamine 5'-phosphate oxidase family protein n=1 Tax=Caulobacter sp. KR2-114 TaxID=3400912 RepID=UPI003C0585C9